MFRRPDHDKFGDAEHACRLHGIEADGEAGAGIPDQLRRRVKESRKPDGERREIGRYDISEARHGSVRRRLSQAEWRSRRYGRGLLAGREAVVDMPPVIGTSLNRVDGAQNVNARYHGAEVVRRPKNISANSHHVGGDRKQGSCRRDGQRKISYAGTAIVHHK